MIDPQLLETIRAIAQPILDAAATELVELVSYQQGRQIMIRLLVDKVGGVTIQDCARLNQRIGDALEASASLTESYTLEVSSPGLDRPLASKRDFERALGESIQVDLTAPLNGAHQFEGTVLAVQPEAVVVTTRWGNTTIPFASIRRAIKAIHW